ncbi:vanadium-dependent haloperoxidase [Roseiconus lacunae]|uniref:vanadium-dependent haloperoxidase n=1 Tax=Roseiconus lacunae TaxID=2605694 RepID=UPI0011F16AB9|nr:vanadium-dependent haloperoxidase [Roseiconus lacunae]
MAKKKARRTTSSDTARRQNAKKKPAAAEPATPTATNDCERPCQVSQQRLQAILDNIDCEMLGKHVGAAFFHKGLQHDSDGLVADVDFGKFVESLATLNQTGNPNDLVGIAFEPDNRKWVNPLSGWSVDTELSDPCFHHIPAPPALTSEEAAAEAIELYWMANLRDIPFARWGSDENANKAIEELSDQKLYIDPTKDVNAPPTGTNGYVSRTLDVATLFRGGDLFAPDPLRERVGPYLSQFLTQEIPYGTLRVDQRVVYGQPYRDYMVDVDEWRAIQNGEPRTPNENVIGDTLPGTLRYISTMRDLATYVHFDQLYQAYLNAALILLQNSYPFGEGNPYGQACPAYPGIGSSQPRSSDQKLGQNQEGFGTFGGAHVLSLVTEAATRALKAVWRQKWTHLRLRPEVYGGLVSRVPNLIGAAADTVTASAAYRANQKRHPTGLLPMAFPEGSPMHPAYGAGHATVAGACVTILKAFFKESEQIRSPKISSACGQHLEDYDAADAGYLTVGMELDKLAANISIGRNMAGVHWRSDYTQSILLGQRVAVDMLYRQSRDYVEDFCFHFTTYGGGEVHLDKDGVDYAPPGAMKQTVLSGASHGHPDRIARDQDKDIADALLAIV